MRTIKLNGHKVVMYDNINELNITRFQQYNSNLMLDAGIGSDLDAFDTRCSNVRRLINSDPAAAQREIINLQQNVRFLVSNVSPEMNAFAVLVHSIDGRIIANSELHQEGIERIIAELGNKGLTIEGMRDFLQDVKKKLTRSLNYFSQRSRTMQK